MSTTAQLNSKNGGTTRPRFPSSSSSTSNRSLLQRERSRRRYSISSDKSNANDKTAAAARAFVRPTVIWNNEDVTPEPLFRGGGGGTNGTSPRSVDSLPCLKVGTADGTFLPKEETPPPPTTKKKKKQKQQQQPRRGIGWLDAENSLLLNDGSVIAENESMPIDVLTKASPNDKTHQNDDDDDDDVVTTDATPKLTRARHKTHTPANSNHDNDDAIVVVATLKETPTKILFSLAGTAVSTADPERASSVKDRNDAIDERHRNRERYSELSRDRSAQTFHNSTRTRGVMATPPLVKSVGTVILPGDLDGVGGVTTAMSRRRRHREVNVTKNATFGNVVEWITSAAMRSEGCLLDVSEGRIDATATTNLKKNREGRTDEHDPKTLKDILESWQKNDILTSPRLLERLNWMERVIEQTHNVREQLKYRTVPIGNEAEIISTTSRDDSDEETTTKENDDDDVPSAVSMPRLFLFKCHLSEGRPVNCLCWHKLNKDILAAGYGSKSTHSWERSHMEDGSILFWSLRNTSHPERILRTSSGVTSIDYSNNRPAMLAVGMADGKVALYDTSKKTNDPVLESDFTSGRHMVPVWQVKWVDQGSERGERLLSIASDGKILEWEWYTHKGLKFTSLMLLKRIGSNNGPISRHASGLCFDFPLGNSIVYLAGSEDGYIYRCSCSYNEQHLDAFKGHAGPVTQLRCSPFSPDVVISCSADWTAKLWSSSVPAATTSSNSNSGRRRDGLVHEFRSMDLFDVVNDVAWSRTISTVFALVAGDGRVEVWDLGRSTLDPVVKLFGSEEEGGGGKVKGGTRKKRCGERLSVIFGDKDYVLVTGSESGDVEVFSLRDVLPPKLGHAENHKARQIEQLNNIISRN